MKRAFKSRVSEGRERLARKAGKHKSKKNPHDFSEEDAILYPQKDLDIYIKKMWKGMEYFEASNEEVEKNARARSAKLRVARKT